MIETKFKNSEVGLIPEDWKVCTIEEIKANIPNAFVDGPFGSNLKTEHFVRNGNVYVIESSSVTSGIFEKKEYKTITNEHFETIKRSECRGGDVIIAKIGMNCGMCAELPQLDKKSVVSGNSLKITLDQKKMLNSIFIAYLNTAKKQGRFEGLVSVSAQPALSLRILNPFLLPLPSRTEQPRIAAALSDMDDLIATLKKLIEKKRNIKQGAMQELLSGKRRLPGFAEEWVEMELMEICDRYDNLRVPVTAAYRKEGNTPYYGANGIQDYVEGYTHDGEFILIAEDGANSLTDYPIQYVNGKVWVNNHAHVVKAKVGKADNKYLLYGFKTIDFEANVDGSTRKKLTASRLMQLKINLPCNILEQSAIAQVFFDMDEEISMLESLLAKYQFLKQGIMQQLLTGKIRLI